MHATPGRLFAQLIDIKVRQRKIGAAAVRLPRLVAEVQPERDITFQDTVQEPGEKRIARTKAVYHVELESATLHFFREEWHEFVALIQNAAAEIGTASSPKKK